MNKKIALLVIAAGLGAPLAQAESFALVIREVPGPVAAAKQWAGRAPAALSGRVDIHRVPASPAMNPAK